jgi:hypothetical protein
MTPPPRGLRALQGTVAKGAVHAKFFWLLSEDFPVLLSIGRDP